MDTLLGVLCMLSDTDRPFTAQWTESGHIRRTLNRSSTHLLLSNQRRHHCQQWSELSAILLHSTTLINVPDNTTDAAITGQSKIQEQIIILIPALNERHKRSNIYRLGSVHCPFQCTDTDRQMT